MVLSTLERQKRYIAGQKKLRRQKVCFYMDKDETAAVREFIKNMRKLKKVTTEGVDVCLEKK